MLFWRKKTVEVDQSEEIARLMKRITVLENQVLSLVMEQDHIRDKVLKKFARKEKDTEKDLYSGVLLPE